MDTHFRSTWKHPQTTSSNAVPMQPFSILPHWPVESWRPCKHHNCSVTALRSSVSVQASSAKCKVITGKASKSRRPQNPRLELVWCLCSPAHFLLPLLKNNLLCAHYSHRLRVTWHTIKTLEGAAKQKPLPFVFFFPPFHTTRMAGEGSRQLRSQRRISSSCSTSTELSGWDVFQIQRPKKSFSSTDCTSALLRFK